MHKYILIILASINFYGFSFLPYAPDTERFEDCKQTVTHDKYFYKDTADEICYYFIHNAPKEYYSVEGYVTCIIEQLKGNERFTLAKQNCANRTAIEDPMGFNSCYFKLRKPFLPFRSDYPNKWIEEYLVVATEKDASKFCDVSYYIKSKTEEFKSCFKYISEASSLDCAIYICDLDHKAGNKTSCFPNTIKKEVSTPKPCGSTYEPYPLGL